MIKELPPSSMHKTYAAIVGAIVGGIVAKYSLNAYAPPEVVAQVADGTATWLESLLTNGFQLVVSGGFAGAFTYLKKNFAL